jgi:hypothetical protein
MILILLAALCLLSVPLMGGKLSRLVDLRLRFVWAAPVALVLQVLIFNIVPGGSESLHAAIHISTYVLLALFMCANRRVPGALVMGSGALLNAVTIIVNGGIMPQWRTAERLAGLPLRTGFHNSEVLAHPHLQFLGDVIPVPAPFGLQNVLSVGDCVLFAGVLVLLHRTCGTRLRLKRRRARVPAPSRPALTFWPAVADVDAMLGSALTSFQAVLGLWQAGVAAETPLGRRTLDTFHAATRGVGALAHHDDALGHAGGALAKLASDLDAWHEGQPLDQRRERALVRSERLLTAARSAYLLGQHRPHAPMSATPASAAQGRTGLLWLQPAERVRRVQPDH